MALLTSNAKAIEEDTQRAAAEVQLQKYGEFIEDYSEKLNRLQERLQHHSNSINNDNTPNPSTMTIALNFEPIEQADAGDVINCDNKIVDKIVRVFTSLCSEVSFLRNEMNDEYLNLLLYYADDDVAYENANENAYEDGQLSVSKILIDLQRLSCFVDHCERVLLEITSQLSAFYRLDLEIAETTIVYEVFEALGETLTVLITIQEAILNNTGLIYHWSLYKRTVQLASHNSVSDVFLLPYSAAKISQLDRLITKLESRLIAGKIFDNVLGLAYDRKTNVTNNKRLQERLNAYLRSSVVQLERTTRHENVESAASWTKICATFVLSINLFGDYDKKVAKSLSIGVSKFALITLRANVIFRIDEFLSKYAGHLLKSSEKKLFAVNKNDDSNNNNNNNNILREITNRLNNDTPFYAMQVLSWILKLEQALLAGDIDICTLNIDSLREINRLLLEGIRYGSCVKTTLSTICNLYVSKTKPMSRTSAVSFCKLIEILIYIEYVYHRHHNRLANLINYLTQYAKYECIGAINAVRKRLINNDSAASGRSSSNSNIKNNNQIDTVSSLTIAIDSLNGGPATELRINVTKLCLNLIDRTYLTDVDRQRLIGALENLSDVCKLRRNLTSLLECSFIYRNRDILSIYLDEIRSKRYNVKRAEYLLQSILLRRHRNDQSDDRRYSDKFKFIIDTYERLYYDCLRNFNERIVRPLCARIEGNLRMNVLQQHLNHHPFRNDKMKTDDVENPLFDFYYVESSIVYLDGKYFDVKKRIEDYLNKTYYDLTTVAAHNYRIHGEMKLLAERRLGLKTLDDNLPNRGLEYGTDLLELTRNLDAFVANYLYNLNNQIFVEKRSNNKYLNTVNIKHISNSIRSHGTGIVNTVVNYTYRLLKRLLVDLSQYLFDEQIKSRLLKDITVFKETNDTSNNESDEFKYYPFERAERFNRGLRQKLLNARFSSSSSSCNSSISSYVDELRALITRIGNALGYVRMIKSGSLHCCADSTVFIPNFRKRTDDDSNRRTIDFEQLCRTDGMSELCRRTAAEFDDAVRNVTDKITSDGTNNYFELMVNVFARVLRDSKNDHLRAFYAIIPPLTINFVDYFIAAKETMIKNANNHHNTTDDYCCFTDDGFAMGIAYLLEVLNLQTEFDSLHWFQSVADRNRKVVTKLEANIETASDDSKLRHTVNLSLKRIKQYQKEFDLLSYNLYSARVLFANNNNNHNDNGDSRSKPLQQRNDHFEIEEPNSDGNGNKMYSF